MTGMKTRERGGVYVSGERRAFTSGWLLFLDSSSCLVVDWMTRLVRVHFSGSKSKAGWVVHE